MSSDLRMLREFGESRTPPTDQPPAELRRRVLAGAQPQRARRPRRTLVARPAWRLAAAGAAAAAVTAATLVAQTGHLAGSAPPQAGASPEAVRILQLAAHEVSTAPALTARPDQFVFVESVDTLMHAAPAGRDPSGRRVIQATLVPQLTDRWNSVDGTHGNYAHYRPWGSSRPKEQPVPDLPCRDGRRVIDAAKPGVTERCTPRPAVRPYLPTDADAMQRYLYRSGDEDASGPGQPADEKAFDRAGRVIEASLTAPAVQAAVFRAVAQIPGVTVVPGVVDAAGRPAVAVTRVEGQFRFELLFDPKTGRYLGSGAGVVDLKPAFQDAVVRGLPPRNITTQTAILRVAVVDRANQLP